MLTPEWMRNVTKMPEAIAERFHLAIIQKIVARMMARLGRGDELTLTPADEYQLRILEDAGKARADIAEDLARFTGEEAEAIRAVMDESLDKNNEADDEVFKTGEVDPDSVTNKAHLLALEERNIEATKGELDNFTRTTADGAQRAYIEACDKAYTLVSSGAVSFSEAVKDALDELAAKGVTTVAYPSGRVDTIETAVARAVRTGVAQAAGQITLSRLKAMKWEIVLTSAHVGARCKGGIPENHEMWQGRFFSLPEFGNQFPDFYQGTGFGTMLGLCGINCRHSFSPGDGVNNPYEKHPIDTEENRKLYEAEQKARGMERKIRKTKRAVAAYETAVKECKDPKTKEDLKDRLGNLKGLLKRERLEYDQFIKDNGLKESATGQYIGGQRLKGSKIASMPQSPTMTEPLASYGNTERAARSEEEIKGRSNEIAEEVENDTGLTTRWSRVTEVDNKKADEGGYDGAKYPECYISVKDTVNDQILYHEHGHAVSKSDNFDLAYWYNGNIEEATVELYAKEKAIQNGWDVYESMYDELVTICRVLNNTLKLFSSDYDMAIEMLNVKLEDRYEWLHNLVKNKMPATWTKAQKNEALRYVGELYGSKHVRK